MRTVGPGVGDWQYFAEGAANVLFQYAGSDAELKRKLLRLRKNTPGAPSTQEVYRFASTHLEPLGQYIVPTELVLVSPELLRELDGYGVNAGEQYALLVDLVGSPSATRHKLPNCTVQEGDRSLVVEFKPKWLAQSPNAPLGAQLCRTCALRRKRGKPEGFCPLDLGAEDSVRVERAVKALFRGYSPRVISSAALLAAVTEFVLESDLMRELKMLQSWDSKGVLGYDELPVDFLVATTARDCTLFLEIDIGDVGRTDDREDFKAVRSAEGIVYIRGRLIDLDVKSPAHKRQYWAGIERSLLDDGWYFDSTNDHCSC